MSMGPANSSAGILEPVMRHVEEGWVAMGSANGRDDEKPVHRVRVRAFDLAIYQVTNSEYGCFLRGTRHPKPPTWGQIQFSAPQQPVVSVSWFDAVAYCDWLSRTRKCS